MPTNLATTVAGEPLVADWASTLPCVIGDLARHWSLDVGAPFEPGGMTSWTAPARTADGAPTVLKIARRHYEAEHEADGLRAWAGHGAVRLIDFVRLDERSDALLLEACDPGIAASVLPEPAQDEVVAAVLRRLWIHPPAGSPFRPLASMCAAWADEMDTRPATAMIGDAGLVRAGVGLFYELAAHWAGADVLLATDLHAGNVLTARREPWLAKDPKPYIGDPTYDVLQHLLNCPDRLTAAPLPLVERMAGLLDLDPARLGRWLFARCVLECPGRPELAAVARALIPA
ncbi:MAG: streptomycin 6-kinase [Pseudonocardiales bacterium]|nr:streptomycin 6-kinase [Pseudonocardiales bacterium]